MLQVYLSLSTCRVFCTSVSPEMHEHMCWEGREIHTCSEGKAWRHMGEVARYVRGRNWRNMDGGVRRHIGGQVPFGGTLVGRFSGTSVGGSEAHWWGGSVAHRWEVRRRIGGEVQWHISGEVWRHIGGEVRRHIGGEGSEAHWCGGFGGTLVGRFGGTLVGRVQRHIYVV